jgi:predicted transposase/invertase (TIGR01784 family)
LPKIDAILDKPVEEMTDLEQWSIFFRYVTDKSKRDIINRIIGNKEAIRMATDILEVISKDEKERIRYESELIFDLDQRSRFNGAWREGEAEGIKKGRTEGRTEGRAEERITIARKMLKRSRPIDEIIEDTGLTLNEIENLQDD